MQKRGNVAHMIIPAAVGMGSFMAHTGVKNLGEYLGLMNLRRARAFFGNQASNVMRAGFRDGISGKKVGRYGPVALGSGALAGATPMSMYEQGHELGKKVVDMSKSTGIAPMKLLEGVRKADDIAQTAISTAPYTGTGIGAVRGLLQERHSKPEERHYGHAAAVGATKGAVLGLGVRHFLPHAAGIRHLHALRTGQIDTLLDSENASKIEKLFGRVAKPEAAERNIASEAFEKGMHGQPLSGWLFSGKKRRARREGLAAGKAFSDRIDALNATKIPFTNTPLRKTPIITKEKARAALPKIDDFLRKALRLAPVIGAGAGAAADLNAERHKVPEKRHYARAAGVGALKGGALGAAVGHFAPHTEAIKSLHEYREKFFG